MRSIAYNANFVRSGKYAFDAVMFSGALGVYTGVKEGAFSISENKREPVDNYNSSLIENLILTFSGFSEVSWVLRDTLDQCNDYQCAYNKISKDHMSTLGYVILAGTKGDEGAIIARDRLGPAHIDQLSEKDGVWYLVQTNNDHWSSDKRKGGCFYRCAAAKKHIEQIGQDKIELYLITKKVLKYTPNVNKETIYTSML